MLRYVDRGAGIRIYRLAPTASGEKLHLLASVDKRRFAVKAIPDTAPTEEEAREIEAFAFDLKNADQDRKTAVLEYPALTTGVMHFYETKATDADRQLINAPILRAMRTMKKHMPAAAQNEKKAAKASALMPMMLPTPEVLAGMLYNILSQNIEGKVTGKPGGAEQTRISGSCDLVEVARALLSLPGEEKAPKEPTRWWQRSLLTRKRGTRKE